MPRQTYLSKDFFVNASEFETKELILALPEGIDHIKFISEDDIRHTLNFIYKGHLQSDDKDNCVSVSLLPLSINQTMISLQASHANGSAFHKDVIVTNALNNFEKAIVASANGKLTEFMPLPMKDEKKRIHVSLLALVALGACIVYLLKGWF
ncbi:MAG TPA: hypothetical protein VM935_02260 [Chitinophagaceae bacterium]|nr:hypothetical protein [Chitinophagaceae bacterium]